jgi:hypothetical protein
MAARASHVLSKVLTWLAVITALIGWVPLLCVLLSYAIAQLGHCQIDEGSVHPCVFYGADLGEFLYGLAMMGWLFLLTFPAAIASVLLWLVVWFLRRRRNRV